MGETGKGIRIIPGKWRPHYPYEHIVWVSPPWPCEDYIWLDFPEAVFTDKGLHFLSHYSPRFPTLNPEPEAIPWEETEDGVTVKRILPDGIRFSASAIKKDTRTVSLAITVENKTEETLRGITLQTCAYLRAVRELSEFTNGNKLVHLPEKGWLSIDEAQEDTDEKGSYRIGWRAGPKEADLPVILTKSEIENRYVAMTWFGSTYSLIGNPHHPCMHADPKFRDIEPGGSRTVRGALIFFEGKPADFEKVFAKLNAEHKNEKGVE